MPSQPGSESPGFSKLNETIVEAFLSELYFECGWTLGARNRLTQMIAAGDLVLGANPVDRSLERWACVDEMLVHLNRLDRLMNPVGGRSSQTYNLRRQLADLARARGYNPPSDAGQLAAVRNIVEHADEHLPQFILDNLGKALGPVDVGPQAGPKPVNNYVPMRAYDTLTEECFAHGETVNLSKLLAEVRELKFRLPKPGVSARLGAVTIPEPESS